MIEKDELKDKPIKKTKKKTAAKAVKVKPPTLEKLLKTGAHFGHRTSKWNSKMEPYIFTTRNNVHIIDLEKTYQKLEEALKFLQEIKSKKGIVLFVGTKISAKEIIKEEAKKCKMPYAAERWIGGTLTNFKVISKRLSYLRDLENKQKTGELEKYTKKEQHNFSVELKRLNQQFEGIKEMTKMPDALFIAGVKDDGLAAKEARMKNIPTIGLCDTNSDPSSVDFPIPANDDASSALKLIIGAIADALK